MRSSPSPLVLMLGGAAIAVVVLLPLVIHVQRANNRAFARLELELERARSVGPSDSTPTQTPAPSAAGSAPDAREIGSGDRSRREVMSRGNPPDTRKAQPKPIEPAVAAVPSPEDVSGAAQPHQDRPASAPPAPVTVPTLAPIELAPDAPPVDRVTVEKVRVRYAAQCMQVAAAVAERLIAIGLAPEMSGGAPRGLSVSRAFYRSPEQLQAASQIADELASITPIELVEDARGRDLDAIDLQLAGRNNCGRGVVR